MSVDREDLANTTVEQLEERLKNQEDLEYLDELAAAERDGKNRSTALEAIERRISALQNDEAKVDELPEYEKAPVDEIIPIIRAGDWARISGTASGVPTHARGRDVSIVHTVIHRAGGNTITAGNHEYQLPSDPIQVKLRDNNEEFTCTRAAFAAFGPDRGALPELVAVA